MNVELTHGKDVDVSPMLRERIEQKLAKVESRLGQKLSFRVRIEKEHNDYVSHIHFHETRDFDANASDAELSKSVDAALQKIESQVRKYHDRHDQKSGETIRETVDLDVEE
jgi:ribosomal subunit interface protein